MIVLRCKVSFFFLHFQIFRLKNALFAFFLRFCLQKDGFQHSLLLEMMMFRLPRIEQNASSNLFGNDHRTTWPWMYFVR